MDKIDGKTREEYKKELSDIYYEKLKKEYRPIIDVIATHLTNIVYGEEGGIIEPTGILSLKKGGKKKNGYRNGHKL